jgi:large subunit ribosomal protein L7/L12
MKATTSATYDVVLLASGNQTIPVIKAIRDLRPDLGLWEARDLKDTPGSTILSGVSLSIAQKAKNNLKALEATVQIRKVAAVIAGKSPRKKPLLTRDG